MNLTLPMEGNLLLAVPLSSRGGNLLPKVMWAKTRLAVPVVGCSRDGGSGSREYLECSHSVVTTTIVKEHIAREWNNKHAKHVHYLSSLAMTTSNLRLEQTCSSLTLFIDIPFLTFFYLLLSSGNKPCFLHQKSCSSHPKKPSNIKVVEGKPTLFRAGEPATYTYATLKD